MRYRNTPDLRNPDHRIVPWTQPTLSLYQLTCAESTIELLFHPNARPNYCPHCGNDLVFER